MLLVRPKQLTDESSIGYRMRLAHRNGLPDPGWLELPTGSQPNGRLKCCSPCLSTASPYWRSAWSANEWPICIDHGAWLRSACVHCARPITPRSARLTHCSCGAHYGDQPVQFVSGALVRVIQEREVSPAILLWLGSLCVLGPGGKPLKSASRRDPESINRLLQTGAEVVVDWPNSFLRATVRHIGADAGVSSSTTRLLIGKLVRQLRKLPDAPWRERVTLALQDLCGGGTGLLPAFSSKSPSLAGKALSPREAAARLGIGSVRTRKLVAALPGREPEVRAAGGRQKVALSESDVETIRQSLRERISTKDAARLLGLTPRRVTALLSSGVIPGLDGKINRSAIQAWVSQLSLRASSWSQKDVATWVSISAALQGHVLIDRTAEFFAALGQPEMPLRVRVEGQRFGEWLVPLDCLLDWSRMGRAALPGLSVPEAAERLGLKQQVVYQLVRQGLLKTVQTGSERRPEARVTEEALAEFRASYVPLIELATVHGVRPRDAYEWAKRQGLVVPTGPKVDGSRQYFAAVVR